MTTWSSRLPSSEGMSVDRARPRVLVVDDSAPQRAAIAELLEEGGCEVVGRAMDGSMALQFLEQVDPDVITCDLEMPRMDGFTFLRILNKTRATPVIVITSDARPEAALMALELGARDFVVKPNRPSDFRQIGNQLLARVRALAAARRHATPTWSPSAEVALPRNISLVVIGASTGGPRALRDVIGRWRGPPRVPVLIAQHMPPRFTEAFADRLRKLSAFDVREAIHGEIVRAGQVRVAPGGRNLRVEASGDGWLTLLVDPAPTDRWVPNVDVLFQSAAQAARDRVLGIVLTGMGRDGVEGARALFGAGAPLWTESPLTAAIDGMPQSAAQAHGAPQRLPLDQLAAALARLVEQDEASAR